MSAQLKHPENPNELMRIWVECAEPRDIERLHGTLKLMTPLELEQFTEHLLWMIDIIAGFYMAKVAEQ